MWVVLTQETWIEYEIFPFLKDFNENVTWIFNSIWWLLDQETKNFVNTQIFDLTTELWKLLRSQKWYTDTLNEWIWKINLFIKEPWEYLILWETNIFLEEYLSNYIWRYYRILDFKLTKILNKIYWTHFEPKDFRKTLVKVFWEKHNAIQNFDIYQKEWLSYFKETRKQHTHHTKSNDDLYVFDWLKFYNDWNIFLPEITFWNKRISIQDFMKVNTTHLINFSEDVIVYALESLIMKFWMQIFLNDKENWKPKYVVYWNFKK